MTQSTTDTPAVLPDAVHAALSPALTAQGYTQLTPVQLAMLDDAHEDADLLVSAQTGSGKTVAFGIAIASTLLGNAERFETADLPLGLVIAPTRELALQVQRELDWLYGKAGIRIATCVGGMDMRTERRALERGAHLVVGTPGRLRDHITKGVLDLSNMRAVVLDEADEMLDLGFREDLEFILAAAPEERRTLLFSATVPRAIAEMAKTFQRDAVRVTATAATEQHADIEYRMTLVRKGEGEHAIINTLLMSDSKSALVFCHTREAVRHLTARLANRGFSVVALSGELAQSERSSALQAMRDGRAHVCVATDVAARGIDLPNLDLVIHADLPTNPATLLHRSGRTGRAGRKGVCVLIVPEHRRKAAERVLSFAKLSASVAPAPTIAEIEARYRAQILAAGMDAAEPDETEAEFVAELVAKVPAEKLATAFLRQQMALRPVAEEISQVDPSMPSKARRKDKFDKGEPREFGERPARGPDMVGGVWFTLSLGRKHRADPKWLLPMICKAGGVTKREVGSIKIDETETRFEIAGEVASDFAQRALNQRLEKGVTISRSDGKAAWSPAGQPKHKGKTPYNPEGGPAKPKYKPAGVEGAAGKPKFKSAKADGKPKFKPKTDGGNGKVYKKPKPKK